MKRLRQGLAAAALFAGSAAFALPAEVVVLKGGTVIELKQPMVRRGNTIYLTRADGTAFSVPASEIDKNATAAARAAVPPPPAAPQAQAPATPAEAVRANGAATKDGAKAKVKITDSDVSHPLDLSSPEAGGGNDKDKAKKELAAGGAKVELVQYDQKKEGNDLIVTGQLRNPTQQLAENVKLNVTVLDEKGQPIDAASANLSNGAIESGDTIQFTAKIAVGERIPASLRFAPTWSGPKPTPAAAPSKPAAGAAAAGANRPAAPAAQPPPSR